MVYPDNLSIEVLVKENPQLRDTIAHAVVTDNQEKLLKLSASNIRSDIRNMKSQPWPPNPDELNENYMKLPASLVTFLSNLFMDDTSRPERSSRRLQLVESVGQDCVYAITGGRVIPAKHILLPWGIKSLTGNVEVIKLLNRFGHGMSYDKLEEMDTALCIQKLSTEHDHGVILPTNTHPCVPATLAFDNIDRLEETLSGGGTSHRVTGIIVQPQVMNVPPCKITTDAQVNYQIS